MKPVILARCCRGNPCGCPRAATRAAPTWPRGRTTGLEMSGNPRFCEAAPSGILFFLQSDSRHCATEEFGEETVRSSCWHSKLSS